MDTSNTALIQDEVLINVSNVIEKGWPAGPSFLNSLGSLIEAAAIHDKVYFNPMGHTLEVETHDDRVPSLLLESDFVQQLIREGILSVFRRARKSTSICKRKKAVMTIVSLWLITITSLCRFQGPILKATVRPFEI